MFLYLDDRRNPFFELPLEIQENYKIFLVRDFKEFEAFITTRGIPEFISFDHDLHPEHYTPEFFWNDYSESKKYQEFVKKKYKNPTGEDCALWLRTYCGNKGFDIPKYLIHSANPVGSDWIRELLPMHLEVSIDFFINGG